MAGNTQGSGVSRRTVLKAAAATGVAAAAWPLRGLASIEPDNFPGRIAASKLPAPYTTPFFRPPVMAPVRTDATTDYYDVRMKMFSKEIIPGFQTTLFGYNGEVPGATIRAQRNRRVVVRMANELPAVHPTLGYIPTTSTHLHGSPSLPQYDGYANDLSAPGFGKDYVYENSQLGRTMWYHDHGHHHTAENVYFGLAGQYHLIDPAESAFPLPTGDYDVPLILGDVMFKSDGSLLFSQKDNKGMWGDVNLVNGRPWPAMKVARRKYRFRIVNASVSRSFRLELSNGDPLRVIATDGGLMSAPKSTARLKIAAGERYEVVIDFAKFSPGTRILLNNISPPNNTNFVNSSKVMAFDVTDEAFDRRNNAVPPVMRVDDPVMTTPESAAVAQRVVTFERTLNMWTINGKMWHDVEASNFEHVESTPTNGTYEIWELQNDSGGWFHPAHIHLVDFRILTRNGKAPFAYEQGSKDVVYLGEGERIRLLVKVNGVGKYMIHCHNLAHEDHDMMTQFEAIDPNIVAPDPWSVPSVPIANLPAL